MFFTNATINITTINNQQRKLSTKRVTNRNRKGQKLCENMIVIVIFDGKFETNTKQKQKKNSKLMKPLT